MSQFLPDETTYNDFGVMMWYIHNDSRIDGICCGNDVIVTEWETPFGTRIEATECFDTGDNLLTTISKGWVGHGPAPTPFSEVFSGQIMHDYSRCDVHCAPQPVDYRQLELI